MSKSTKVAPNQGHKTEDDMVPLDAPETNVDTNVELDPMLPPRFQDRFRDVSKSRFEPVYQLDVT